MLIDDTTISADDMIFNSDRYYHWDFHGNLSGTDPEQNANLLNDRIQKARQFLKETEVLFLTLGTANAFLLKSEERIVANCHKFPNDNFSRIELAVDEITVAFQSTIDKLKLINPKLKIVFTVSPVRHIRDGLINNQLSKAKLIQTVNNLCKSIDDIFYFPSYELVMDDLRDYRFYTEDMLHINDVGLSYIWDYFKSSFFSDSTQQLIDRIWKINNELAHKPFHPDSDKHQVFLNKLLKKINSIISEHSHIDFCKEIALIKKQIIN